jgi:hypothetical protein
LLSRGVLNYLHKLKVSKLSQFGRVKTLKFLSSTCGACVWIGRAIILDPTHSLVKNQGGASGDGESLLQESFQGVVTMGYET